MAGTGQRHIRRAWHETAALTYNALMRDKHVLLGVIGAIAAYKGADLVRRMMERGAEVNDRSVESYSE